MFDANDDAKGEFRRIGPTTDRLCVLATSQRGSFAKRQSSVPSRRHDEARRRKRGFTLPNSPVGRGRQRPEKAAFAGGRRKTFDKRREPLSRRPDCTASRPPGRVVPTRINLIAQGVLTNAVNELSTSERVRSNRTTAGEVNHAGFRNFWCRAPDSGAYSDKAQAAGREHPGGGSQDCQRYDGSDRGDAGLDLVWRKYSGVAGRPAAFWWKVGSGGRKALLLTTGRESSGT